MIKLNVKIETLKKDLEILKQKGVEKIPEFSLSQINLLIEKEEVPTPPSKKEDETEEKHQNLSIFIFLGLGIFVVIILGILWLVLGSTKTTRPNQPILPVQSLPQTEQLQQTSTIQETQPISTSSEPTSSLSEENFVPLIKADKEVNVTLQDLNANSLKEVLLGEKIKKEEAFSFKKINLWYLNQRPHFGILFQKIFNPQVENTLSLKGFLDNFENYDLGIYYTPTREYLIIIAKIKNPNVVKTFFDYWLKPKPDVDELNFIFLTDNPGKNLAKYEVKKLDDFDLIKVAYEKAGYGFNLLLSKNSLVIFPHEAVLEYAKTILKQLQ